MLIVCFRFIGDVLVTTPLVSSIKEAMPAAQIDYLVFEGTDGVVSGNPQVRKVVTMPSKESNFSRLLPLLNEYDLAIAAYPSDRTLVAAAVAGRRSVGLVYPGADKWWKKLLLSARCYCDDRNHVVANILSLLEPCGIDPVARVSMGTPGTVSQLVINGSEVMDYILLHPYSRNRCKYWPEDHWGQLAGLIEEQTHYRAVFTVTPDPDDARYLQRILSFAPKGVMSLQKPQPLDQLASLVASCSAFVGIDTVVTHMAASLDIPVCALYGPSLTRYWAPWPNGCEEASPYSNNRGVQRSGNITVIQKNWPCVPCNRETCAISARGRMECLEELTPEEVFCELQAVLKIG